MVAAFHSNQWPGQSLLLFAHVYIPIRIMERIKDVPGSILVLPNYNTCHTSASCVPARWWSALNHDSTFSVLSGDGIIIFLVLIVGPHRISWTRRRGDKEECHSTNGKNLIICSIYALYRTPRLHGVRYIDSSFFSHDTLRALSVICDLWGSTVNVKTTRVGPWFYFVVDSDCPSPLPIHHTVKPTKLNTAIEHRLQNTIAALTR